MLGENGSAISYFVALSGTNLAAAGSTNASNFAGYELGTILLATASAPSAQGLVVNVLRSGTSNGTFAGFGASVGANGPINVHKLFVRSFALDSSACWYKASYDNNNVGSAGITTIVFALQEARNVPITQNTNTVTYSDILGG